MEKPRKPNQHVPRYSRLMKEGRAKPSTAADRPLPGEYEEEQNYNIPSVSYADRPQAEQGDEQVLVNFRMSKRRLELLKRWFKQEKDQNFSAGMRTMVDEFMHKHNII